MNRETTAVPPASHNRATLRDATAHIAAQICDHLDRHARLWWMIFIAAFFFSSVIISLRERMWTDEILTSYMVQQPTFRGIIQAGLDGCDASAPLYFLLSHSLQPVLGASATALRLPSLLGVCVAFAALFFFVQRRYPAPYAFIAMLFAANAFRYFGTEARPYGLLLGVAGIALVCWQNYCMGQRRGLNLVVLCLALCVAVALHYYAVFLVLPFLAAELVRWHLAKRIDAAVLAALLIPPLVLIPHLPLISAGRPSMQHFWSPATPETFSQFFVQFYIRIAGFLLLLLPILAIWPPAGLDPKERDGRRMPPYEWVGALALALSPVAVYLASRLTTHVFVDRYVAWATLGFTVLVAALLFRIAPGHAVLACGAIAILGVLLCARQAYYLRVDDPFVKTTGAGAVNSLLAKAPPEPEPILLGSDHIFLALANYGPASLRPRLVYPLDAALKLAYTGFDTDDLYLGAVHRRGSPLRMEDYGSFLSAHPRFLLAVDHAHWLIRHLLRTEYRLTLIRDESGYSLFLVEHSGGS